MVLLPGTPPVQVCIPHKVVSGKSWLPLVWKILIDYLRRVLILYITLYLTLYLILHLCRVLTRGEFLHGGWSSSILTGFERSNTSAGERGLTRWCCHLRLCFSQSFQVVRAIVVRWVLSSEAESFELLVLETSSVNSVSFFGAQNAENGLYGEHFWPSPWRSCHESEHSFNLTSQVVFRHPMDRLVSAYRMIFQNWWVLKILQFFLCVFNEMRKIPWIVLSWY